MPPLQHDEEKFVDIQPVVQLEVEKEEVKEGKRLKILTPNKLLTRLSVLLAQIKAGSNSYKLKTEIRHKYYIFCVNTIKLSKNFASI